MRTAQEYTKNKLKVGFEEIGGPDSKKVAEPVRAGDLETQTAGIEKA